MAYLPGVPDVGPEPISPTIGSSTTIGKPQGVAALALSVGKPGHTENIGSVVGRRGAGISTKTGGDPIAHSLGHYEKGPAVLGGMQLDAGIDPTVHPGVQMVRGGSGVMRRNVREGGLGPGRMSTPGQNTDFDAKSSSNTDYSVKDNSDVE